MAPRRPATVKVTFWTLIVLAVLPLAFVPFALQIFTTAFNAAMAQATVQARRALPPGFAQQMMDVVVPMVWITVIIVAAVQVLVALGIWTGRNWVRIVLTVLTGLSVLSSLAGLLFAVAAPNYYYNAGYANLGPLYAISTVVSVVQLAIQIGIIVLVWLPASNEFFAMSRAARFGASYR
jgi:hypothetical protein